MIVTGRVLTGNLVLGTTLCFTCNISVKTTRGGGACLSLFTDGETEAQKGYSNLPMATWIQTQAVLGMGRPGAI